MVEYYRCKRCREVLFSTSDLEQAHSTTTECSLWFLRSDDKLLPWVLTAVEQGAWQKGKLYCPCCEARLGAFDFVHVISCACGSEHIPAIYCVQSKVDKDVQIDLASFAATNIIAPKGVGEAMASFDNDSLNVPTELEIDMLKSIFFDALGSDSDYLITDTAVEDYYKEEVKASTVDLTEEEDKPSSDVLEDSFDNYEILTDSINHTEEGGEMACADGISKDENIISNDVNNAANNALNDVLESCTSLVSSATTDDVELLPEHVELEDFTTTTTDHQFNRFNTDRLFHEQQCASSDDVHQSMPNEHLLYTSVPPPENRRRQRSHKALQRSHNPQRLVDSMLRHVEQKCVNRMQACQCRALDESTRVPSAKRRHLLEEEFVNLSYDNGLVFCSSCNHHKRRNRVEETDLCQPSRNCSRRPANESLSYTPRPGFPANRYSLLAYDSESPDESPDATTISEHHQCAVCWELFYQPHAIRGCEHVFCAPCIRQLHKSSHRKPRCPLCRQPVYQITPRTELEIELKETYPNIYRKRSHIEQDRPINQHPLPSPTTVQFDDEEDDNQSEWRHSRIVHLLGVLRTFLIIVFLFLSYLVNGTEQQFSPTMSRYMRHLRYTFYVLCALAFACMGAVLALLVTFYAYAVAKCAAGLILAYLVATKVLLPRYNTA